MNQLSVLDWQIHQGAIDKIPNSDLGDISSLFIILTLLTVTILSDYGDVTYCIVYSTYSN